MQITLFHTNIEAIQVLAYSSMAEVPDPARRIVLATHSNGLDISYGMGVPLAREMARALLLAANAPCLERLHSYDERCMAFFGTGQGGVVTRSNESDPNLHLHSITVRLSGEDGTGKPRASLAMTEPKARALAAALLAATEAIIEQAMPQPTASADLRTQRLPDGWPGDSDDIAAARERDAVSSDTLGAVALASHAQHRAAMTTNGGW